MSRVIALIFFVVSASAQAEVNRSWDALVQNVKVGKKVVVTRTNTSNAEGKLLAIDPDTLTVKVRGASERIRREDVFRVRYADIRARHALIGLAAGVGAGFALGAGIGSRPGDDISRGGMGTAIAVIGGGIGAATGGLLPIGEPLYEARK